MHTVLNTFFLDFGFHSLTPAPNTHPLSCSCFLSMQLISMLTYLAACRFPILSPFSSSKQLPKYTAFLQWVFISKTCKLTLKLLCDSLPKFFNCLELQQTSSSSTPMLTSSVCYTEQNFHSFCLFSRLISVLITYWKLQHPSYKDQISEN